MKKNILMKKAKAIVFNLLLLCNHSYKRDYFLVNFDNFYILRQILRLLGQYDPFDQRERKRGLFDRNFYPSSQFHQHLTRGFFFIFAALLYVHFGFVVFW